ncbi:flagellar basal body P-ring formation chaperone FlgA [Deferribacter thermophilus]|uniref:flagellar basal body P-ring formation chaperone FlgA n=1 Tax=Deferribacter thermophilus TaxID=53573 RepID=UPI003C16C6EE
MYRSIITLILLLLVTFVSYAAEITINRDCLYDSDLFYDGKKDVFLCGFIPGEKKIIHQTLLNKLYEKGYNQLKFGNDGIITVLRKGLKIDENTIKNEITNLYKNKYPDVEIEIKRVTAPKDILYSKDKGYKFNFLNDDHFGSVYFNLSTFYKNYKIYAYVRGFKEVYISKVRIKKGETIRDKVYKKKVDISQIKGGLHFDIKDKIAKRTIPKNRVITMDLIKNKPDAFKGEPVKLIYQSKYIFVEAKGVLKEDAYKGDMVEVINPTSNKTIMAKYLGNGIVIIKEN